MRVILRKKTSTRVSTRMTKKARIRKKVNGTAERPRLCVFRSGKHMYAQLINDLTGQTLATVSSLKMDEKLSGKEQAESVGKEIAKMSIAKNITNVVFDRNGFIYHGRVKALADSAREAGLQF